jgi:hypothetical protein
MNSKGFNVDSTNSNVTAIGTVILEIKYALLGEETYNLSPL